MAKWFTSFKGDFEGQKVFTCCLEFQDEPYLYRPLEFILQKRISNHDKIMRYESHQETIYFYYRDPG